MIRLTVIAAAAVLALAASARAETNSRPDGTEHPYVGMFVGDFAADHPGLEPGCSGTLVSPTVFLTAAHCIAHRPERQAVPLFVTFDPQWSYPGSPSDLHPVAAYHWDPGFDEPGFISDHDLAVLILAPPVRDIEPARLPAAGLLDTLAVRGGLAGALLDSVGYGLQGIDRGGGPPRLIGNPIDTGVVQRRATTSAFAALTPDTVHLLTEDAVGLGGPCLGDSGSPHMLAGTRVIIAITSSGDGMCEALSINPRVDTAAARAFLAAYLTLP